MLLASIISLTTLLCCLSSSDANREEVEDGKIVRETTFKLLGQDEGREPVPKNRGAGSTSTLNNSWNKEYSSKAPADNGGNYGDLLHDRRENGDYLLLRETLLNDATSAEELDMLWQGRFNARITHVRVLNFGRERGFCYEITTNNNQGYVEVRVRVPSYKSVRMFVEVYGLRRNGGYNGVVQ